MMTRIPAHPARNARQLAHGTTSAAALAAAMAAAGAMLPAAAHAQAVQASFNPVGGSAAISHGTTPGGAPIDTINVIGPTAVINWTPNDTAAGIDPIMLLDKEATALFIRDVGDFTVLNRVIPGGEASGRAIRIDGSVVSQVSGAPTGTVMFYSPNGIVIGPTGTFDVGSLVLSTLEHPNIGDGEVIFGPNGESAFGSNLDIGSFLPTRPESFIHVENGAQLRGLGVASYVALLSPRIEQRGTIQSNGSAALIAAEEVTLTVRPSGLFDIDVIVGTGDANGIVHEGTTGGSAKIAANPDGRIYMTAVPKATVMNMLLGGSIGFEASGAAVLGNGTVVLSAGFDIAAGDHVPAFPTTPVSDMTISSDKTAARFTSAVDADADRNLVVDARAGDVLFDESTQVIGRRNLAISARGNNTVIAASDFTGLSDNTLDILHEDQPGTVPTLSGSEIILRSSAHVVAGLGSVIEAASDLSVRSIIGSVTLDRIIAGDDITILGGGGGNDILGTIDTVTVDHAETTGLGPDVGNNGSNITILASEQVNTNSMIAAADIMIRASGGFSGLGFIDGTGTISAGRMITIYADNAMTGTSALIAPEVNLGGRSFTLDALTSETTLRTVDLEGTVISTTSLDVFSNVSIGTLTLRDSAGNLLDATINALDINVGTANAADITFTGFGTIRLDNTPGAGNVALIGGQPRSSGTISALSVLMTGSNVSFGTIVPVTGAAAADGGEVRITANDGGIIGGSVRNRAASGGVIFLDAFDDVTVGDLNGQWIEVNAGASATTGVLTSSTTTANFVRANGDITIADTALGGALELTSTNGNVTATRLTSTPAVNIDAAGTVTIGEQTGGLLTAIGADIIGLGPMANGTAGTMSLTSRSGAITLDAVSTGTLTINSAAALDYISLLANGNGTITAAGAGNGGAITSTTGSLDIGFGDSSAVGAVTAALDIDFTVTGNVDIGLLGNLDYDEITAGRVLTLVAAGNVSGNLAATNAGRLRGGQGATINANSIIAGAVQGGTGSLLVTSSQLFNAASASAAIDVTIGVGTSVNVTGASSAGDDFRVTATGPVTFAAITASGGPDADADGHRISIVTGGNISTGNLLAEQTAGLQRASVDLDSGTGSIASGSISARTDITLDAATTLTTGALTAGDDIRASSLGNAALGSLAIDGRGPDTEPDEFNIIISSGGTLSAGGATVPVTAGVALAGITQLQAAGDITVTGSVTRRQAQTELVSNTGGITVNAPTFGASLLDAAGNIAVTSTGASLLALGTVDAGGSVTASSAATGAGAFTFSSLTAGTTASLTSAGNLVGNGAANVGGDFTATANGTLQLTAATSNTGAITLRTLDTGPVNTGALTARTGLTIDGRDPSERVLSITTGNITVSQGDVLLDAANFITTGFIQAANGSISLFKSATTGSITTGLLTVGNDFTLETGGDASFAGVTAGDDIRITAGGTISVGALRTTATGIDGEADGRNITVIGSIARTGTLAIDSVGAVSITGSASATAGLQIAAATTIQTGALSGSAVSVNAGTGISSGAITSPGAVALTNAAGLITTGLIQTGTSFTLATPTRLALGGVTLTSLLPGTIAITSTATGISSLGNLSAAAPDSSIAANAPTLTVGNAVSGGPTDFTTSIGDLTTGSVTARDAITLESGARIFTGDLASTQSSIFLDAQTGITTGNLSALAGSLSILNGTGPLSTGLIAVRDDFILTTASDLVFGGVSAGDDIVITTTGTAQLGSLTTSGAGNDEEADGANIDILTGGALSLAGANANGTFFANSQSISSAGPILAGGNIDIGQASGRGLNPIPGTITLGNLTAGGSVRVLGTGAVDATVGNMSAGNAVQFVMAAGSLTGGAVTTTNGNVQVGSLGALQLGSVTSGNNVVLIGGSITAGDIAADGLIQMISNGALESGALLAGTNVSLDTKGAITTGDITASTGSVSLVNTIGTITTGAISVGTDFTINTGSDLDFGGLTVGDDIRITTAGAANLGRLIVSDTAADSEGDGRNIVLSAGTTLFVDHAETSGNFTASASRFETGPSTIITGGDIDLTIAGDILLGDSQAGGLIRAQSTAGSVSFGTMSSGTTTFLDATGSITGTSATSGGSFQARAVLGINLGTVDSGGNISVGISDTGSAGNIVLTTGLSDRSIGLFNFGSGGISGGSLTAEGNVLALTDAGAITLASLTARGTITEISGGSLGSVSGEGLPVPTGDVFVSAGGALTVTSADAARMLGLGGNGITSTGTLSAGSDIRIESLGAASLAILRAGDDIQINAAGPLGITDAATLGTGPDNTGILDTFIGDRPFFATGSAAPDGSDIVLRTTGVLGSMTLGTIDADDTLDSLSSAATGFTSLAAGGNLDAASQTAMNGGQAQTGGQASLTASGGALIAGNVTSGTGALLTASSTLEAGNVSATSGNVSLTAATGINAGDLLATNGAVQLVNPVGTIAAGTITARDSFILSTGSAVDLGNVSSTAGAIAIDTALDVSTGNLSAVGLGSLPGTITVSGANVTSGDVTAPAQVLLTATTGALRTGTVGAAAMTLDAGTTIDSGNLTAATGDVSLDAGGAITTGDISAANGSVSIANTLGTITTGLITLRDDFTLSTGSDLVFAGVVAGDDIRITTGGSAMITLLETTGTATDSESDGSNIALSSGGDLAVGHAEAATNFFASAASFTTDANTIITGGDISIGVIGDADLGNSQAGGGIFVSAGGAVGFGSISAGHSTSLFAGTTLTGTATTSDGNLSIQADGDVNVGSATATGTAFNPFTDGLEDGYIFVISGGEARLDAASARSMIAVSGQSVAGTGTWQAGEDILVLASATAGLGALVAGNQIDVTAPAGITLGNATTLGTGPADRFVELFSINEPGFLIVSGATPADIRLEANTGAITFAALDAARDLSVTARDGISGTTIAAGRDIDLLASAGPLTLTEDAAAVRNLNLTATSASLRDAFVTGPNGYATLTSTAGALSLRDLTAPGFTLVGEGGGITARDLVSSAAPGSGLEIADINALGGAFSINSITSQGDVVIVGSAGGTVAALVTVGNDFTLTSGGDLAIAAATAGDDIRITTSGAADFGHLMATGTGQDNEPDGSNIVLDAGGSLYVEHGEAADNFTATAASFDTGENTIITGGDIIIVTSGDARLGNSRAGGLISVDAGGSGQFRAIESGGSTSFVVGTTLTGTSTTAGGLFSGTAGADIVIGAVSAAAATLSAGGLAEVGTLSVPGAATIHAAGPISLTQGTIGADLDLLSTGGSVLAPNLSVAGAVTASGTALTLGSPVSMTVTSATATQGNLSITAEGQLAVGSVSAPNGSISLTGLDVTGNGAISALRALAITAADGPIVIQSQALGETVQLRSTDIIIGSTAQVGALDRTIEVLLVNTGTRRTYIGGEGGSSSDYGLSNAEARRIFGRSILIDAPHAASGGSSTSGQSASSPDVILDRLTLSAAAPASGPTAGNMASDGIFRIQAAGRLRTVGIASFANLTASGRVEISAQDAIEIDPAVGGIHLRGPGEAPGGRLVLDSRSIVSASPSAMSDIAIAAGLSDISTRLGLNDNSEVNDLGVMSADAITVFVRESFYLQNTGQSATNPFTGFEKRRGFTAGSGGMTIYTDGPETRIAINGRLIGSDGLFITGLKVIPEVDFDTEFTTSSGSELFDFDSTINGCAILRATACQLSLTQPNEPREAVGVIRETASVVEDSPGKVSVTGVSLVQLSPEVDQTNTPIIDDPVTGAGNDDLWGDVASNDEDEEDGEE